MEIVILTAVSVGGATVCGAVIGFLLKSPSPRMQALLLSFAAGVMLEATMLGLLPAALEGGGMPRTLTVIAGSFLGAGLILLIDRPVKRLCRRAQSEKRREGNEKGGEALSRVALFVLAIAIHNLPEGLAAGVGFGAGEGSGGITIALAIALQNVPEGMVIIQPMLSVGIPPARAFLYAALTGLVEIVGTLVGYVAVTAVSSALPLLLSVAAGTMLLVVVRDMIPDGYYEAGGRSTVAVLAGVAVMLTLEAIIA